MQIKKNEMASFAQFICWAYRPYFLWVVLFVFLCSLAGWYGVISSYLLKVIVDTLGETEGGLAVMDIVWPMIFFLLNYEIYYLSWRGLYYVNLKILPRVKNRIISVLFDYALGQSAVFFQENLSGAITNNINVLVSNIERVVYYPLYTVILGFTQLVITVFMMSRVSWIFSLGLVVWAVLFISISLYFSRRVRVLSNGYARANIRCFSQVHDSIANVSSVRFFANRSYEGGYLEHFLNTAKEKFRKKEYFLLRFSFLQGLSISTLLIFVIFFLVRMRLANELTVGDFAFILTLVLDVVTNVRTLTEQADLINDAIGQCKQSLHAIAAPLSIQDAPDAQDLRITDGTITFTNVTFEYKDSKVLFRDKSVTIPGGQKVGLVGYSGSGKSTFVNLILRLFDVNAGSVAIDGQDVRSVTQDSLRSQIGIIPQEALLFHRTIMENIRYGNVHATDEQVIAAAKKACAHEFIMNFPDGYQTLVGEYGSKLSGGQRQRIAIARAMLKNAPILILDEATSQLDSLSEGQMQKSLLDLMKGKTAITIAHRLRILPHMDRILVFRDGVIVEDGSHEELIGQNGIYTSIWQSHSTSALLDQEGV